MYAPEFVIILKNACLTFHQAQAKQGNPYQPYKYNYYPQNLQPNCILTLNIGGHLILGTNNFWSRFLLGPRNISCQNFCLCNISLLLIDENKDVCFSYWEKKNSLSTPSPVSEGLRLMVIEHNFQLLKVNFGLVGSMKHNTTASCPSVFSRFVLRFQIQIYITYPCYTRFSMFLCFRF